MRLIKGLIFAIDFLGCWSDFFFHDLTWSGTRIKIFDSMFYLLNIVYMQNIRSDVRIIISTIMYLPSKEERVG